MAKLISGWKHRVLALPLLLVYSPDYEIPRAARARLYRSVLQLEGAWPFALYVLASVAAVSVALLALLFAAHRLKPKTLTVLTVFLVVNWLPHTVAVGHWCMLYNPSAWVP